MTELNPIQTEILLKAFEFSKSNLRHLQDRAQTITTWIATLLTAVIGFIGTLAGGKLGNSDPLIRIGLVITVSCLFLFAWITEWLTFRARAAESKASIRIARLLHFFQAGYFDETTVLYDENEWKRWTTDPLRRLAISPGTSVVFILTVVAIMLILTM